jgi:DNA polymerase-4/DNA polymerase V
MSYLQIAERIKQDLDTELGFTFSVGLAPNKVVAKIASKWQKPSGLTAIPGREPHRYLAQLPIEHVWGIGHQTTALLHKHGVKTALQFARQPEAWVKTYFSKPFYQIWQELNGAYIFELVTGERETYHTIQKVKTFTPPSSNRALVFAQLAKISRMPAASCANTSSPPSACCSFCGPRISMIRAGSWICLDLPVSRTISSGWSHRCLMTSSHRGLCTAQRA